MGPWALCTFFLPFTSPDLTLEEAKLGSKVSHSGKRREEVKKLTKKLSDRAEKKYVKQPILLRSFLIWQVDEIQLSHKWILALMDLNHRPFASLKRFEKWEVPHQLIAPFSQQYRSKLVDGQVLVCIAQTVIHGTGSHLYKSAIDQPKNLTRKTYGICTLPATPVKSQKWHPKLAAVRRSQPWLLPPAFRFQKTIWIHWIHGIQGSLSYVFDVCYSKKSNISIYMVWFVQRHKSKASSKTHGKKHTKGQKHLESQWNVQMSHRPPCSPSHLLDVQFQWWATSKSSNSLLGHGGNRMTALTRSLTNCFLS